jgi:hypothetical protein
MQSDHAFLAPSAADIWGSEDGCAAYPRMAAAFPADEETTEAREGQAAHHYVSETLWGAICEVGAVAPNGHVVTQEMVDCAHDLLADVASWRGKCEGRFVVEERLYMPAIHPTSNRGTVDIGGIDLKNRKAYIRDYKFGHRYVDAFENLQCVDYLVGLFRHFAIPLESVADWEIEIGIFQPRCWHPEGPRKIWSTNGARFLELVDQLAYRARKASDPDAEMHTGKHCRDCPARSACSALHLVGGASVDLSYQGAPHDLTPASAGLIRKYVTEAIERLEALQTGLDAQIEAFIKAGKSVPFAERKQGEGREFWTRPLPEIYALGDMFGKELRKPGALTPRQARDAGIDASVVAACSDRKKGEYKVVSVDDNQAAKVFK